MPIPGVASKVYEAAIKRGGRKAANGIVYREFSAKNGNTIKQWVEPNGELGVKIFKGGERIGSIEKSVKHGTSIVTYIDLAGSKSKQTCSVIIKSDNGWTTLRKKAKILENGFINTKDAIFHRFTLGQKKYESQEMGFVSHLGIIDDFKKHFMKQAS